MPHRRVLAGISAAILTIPAPALASSMPAADIGRGTTLGVGVGNGTLSLSGDIPVSSQMTLGVGLGANRAFAGNFDLRGVYRLGNAGPVMLAFVGGVGLSGPSLSNINAFAPMLGLGLAWHFAPQFTLRGNVIVNPLNVGGFLGNTIGGLEIAYRFTPQIEATLGGNGRGDVLGLKFAL